MSVRMFIQAEEPPRIKTKEFMNIYQLPHSKSKAKLKKFIKVY